MNDGLYATSNLVLDSAQGFWSAVSGYLPNILAALVLIILGALVAKIAADITKRALKFFGVNKLKENEAVSNILEKANMQIDFVNLLGQTVFWVVVIIFAMTAAEVLGLNAMRDAIRELLAYLPQVFAAVFVLAVTVAGARLVKAFVVSSLEQFQVDYADIVGKISYGVVAAFGIILAAAQLGFDTVLLTTNLSIIIGGVVAAVALASGIGGRYLAGDLLGGLFTHQAIEEGQEVTVGNVKGTVKEVTPVAVVMDTDDGDVVVSHNQILK